MSAPLVSVGMPVYNGGALLRRALNSVVAMDYPRVEIIISDNASIDGTYDICRAYAQSDSRITLMRQERNIGALKNFQAVVAPAKGEYFMWAAADDWWHPRFVEVLVGELERHQGAVVGMCAVERVLESGEFYDRVRLANPVSPNCMDRKQLLQSIFSVSKLNLFVYGLFRLAQLRSATAHFPDTLGGDRQFIAQMAFAGSFRYVDEVLHVRTYSRSRDVAYRRLSMRKRARAHQVLSFWRMLASSPLVDWRDWRIIWSVVWQYWRFLNR